MLLVPRLAVALGGVALAVIAGAQGRPGGALVLILVLALGAAALPRRGRAWPLAVGAVALGAVALAGAWPALAGRSSARPWARAVLGAAGYVWLAAASALVGQPYYQHLSPAVPAPVAWTTSLPVTVHDLLPALARSGVPAGAAVWALAAVLVPLVCNGRSLARDAVAALIWTAATLTLVELSELGLHGSASAAAPRGALLGAGFGAIVLLVPAIARSVLRAGPLRGRRRGIAPLRSSLAGERVP